jgi:anti-sigma regulatory factor (Ser/Thr protein kinase)
LNFPADKSDQSDEFRIKLVEAFEEKLLMLSNLSKQVVNSLKWLISEAVDNVVEHSQYSHGKMFAQSFKSKGHLDIVILDNGRTILDTYLQDPRNRYPDVKSDVDAVNIAVNGASTKDEAISRGYGISSSRTLLTQGLQGHFFLMSGNAYFYQDFQNKKVYKFKTQAFWPGYFLAMRIPFNEPNGFDYRDFIK